MKKHMWKIIFGLVALALAASFVIANQAAQKADEGVEVTSHIKGNQDAPVTLTEYSDFQCPACAQFYPVVQNILEENSGSIKFEYRHFPLVRNHPYAVPAAQAAEAAGQQGKFFEMHDLLFENQSVWSPSASPDTYFIQYAEQLGLDVGTFKRHLSSSVITDAISESLQDAQSKGLRSTPSFFLNGELMEYETFDSFIGQIEAAVNGETPVAASTTPATDSGIEFGI